jgi:hypothetical protein
MITTPHPRMIMPLTCDYVPRFAANKIHYTFAGSLLSKLMIVDEAN